MAKKSANKKTTAKKKATRKAPKPARRAAQSTKRRAGTPSRASKPKLVGVHGESSGSGASPAEIGAAVVASLNSGGDDHALWNRYWSDDVVSVEGIGMNQAWHGRKAMEEKCAWWLSKNKVHGCRAEGPYVGSSGFSVRITMDVEELASGKRTSMTEIAVYSVRDGKVVREEFMYAC
jgi:hypothetical protein